MDGCDLAAWSLRYCRLMDKASSLGVSLTIVDSYSKSMMMSIGEEVLCFTNDLDSIEMILERMTTFSSF